MLNELSYKFIRNNMVAIDLICGEYDIERCCDCDQYNLSEHMEHCDLVEKNLCETCRGDL